jgi:hypothetical protein
MILRWLTKGHLVCGAFARRKKILGSLGDVKGWVEKMKINRQDSKDTKFKSRKGEAGTLVWRCGWSE